MRTRSQVPLQKKLSSIEEWNREQEKARKPVELDASEVVEVPVEPPSVHLLVDDAMLNDDAPGWSFPAAGVEGYGTHRHFKKEKPCAAAETLPGQRSSR